MTNQEIFRRYPEMIAIREAIMGIDAPAKT